MPKKRGPKNLISADVIKKATQAAEVNDASTNSATSTSTILASVDKFRRDEQSNPLASPKTVSKSTSMRAVNKVTSRPHGRISSLTTSQIWGTDDATLISRISCVCRGSSDGYRSAAVVFWKLIDTKLEPDTEFESYLGCISKVSEILKKSTQGPG